MQFSSRDGWHAASYITGPHHNTLALALGPAGTPLSVERLAATGGCTHQPLDTHKILQLVSDGVKAANAKLGTSYTVAGIRIVENDTPPEAIYGVLAECILHRIASGKAFDGSATVSETLDRGGARPSRPQ